MRSNTKITILRSASLACLALSAALSGCHRGPGFPEEAELRHMIVDASELRVSFGLEGCIGDPPAHSGWDFKKVTYSVTDKGQIGHVAGLFWFTGPWKGPWRSYGIPPSVGVEVCVLADGKEVFRFFLLSAVRHRAHGEYWGRDVNPAFFKYLFQLAEDQDAASSRPALPPGPGHDR
jgi:hypothetical protein